MTAEQRANLCVCVMKTAQRQTQMYSSRTAKRFDINYFIFVIKTALRRLYLQYLKTI